MLWLLGKAGELVLRGAFLAPVAVFAYVSARMNLKAADTFGSDAFTRECFWWLGLAAAAYAGLGLELARLCFKRGAPSKGCAALAFLVLAATYDAMAAYSFSSHELATVEQTRADAERKKAKAKTAVDSARTALAPYLEAPELGAAGGKLKAAEAVANEPRCRLTRISDEEKLRCDTLSTARLAFADAGAKVRLAAELKAAEALYEDVPYAPPAEARARDFGPWLVQWLPVVLLQVGSLLGAYAAFLPSSAKPAPPAPAPEAAAPPLRPGKPEALAAIVPAHQPTAGDVAAAIAGLIHNPATCPKGVTVDRHGWLAGPQRPLAALLNVPVSRFNRELRAAAAAGALELDTSGSVTRIRLGAIGRS